MRTIRDADGSLRAGNNPLADHIYRKVSHGDVQTEIFDGQSERSTRGCSMSLTSDGPYRSPEQLVVFGDAAKGAERKRRHSMMIPFWMWRLEQLSRSLADCSGSGLIITESEQVHTHSYG
jgi:hypothetical protein